MSFLGLTPYKVAFASIPVNVLLAMLPHVFEIVIALKSGVKWDNRNPRAQLKKLMEEKKIHPDTLHTIG